MQLATLCYVQRADRTLMLRRGKKPNDIHQGKWNGLGGKFEPGETPEECVMREVMEESGLQISQLRLAGFLSFPEFKDGVDWYVFVYTAKSAASESIAAEGIDTEQTDTGQTDAGQTDAGQTDAEPADSELIDSDEGELAWIPTKDLTELPLWEGDRIFLPWIAERRFFSAKFIYRNKQLAEHSVSFY